MESKMHINFKIKTDKEQEWQSETWILINSAPYDSLNVMLVGRKGYDYYISENPGLKLCSRLQRSICQDLLCCPWLKYMYKYKQDNNILR